MKESICNNCKRCMKITEVSHKNSAENKYKNCMYNPDIDCSSVTECNKWEEDTPL